MRLAGVERVTAAFTSLRSAIGDLRPAWRKIVPLLAQQQQTLSEGWAPLSPAYAEWKSEHYGGQPLLHRTGALAAAMNEAPNTALAEMTGSRLKFVVRGPDYARFIHHGTSFMPARPLVPTLRSDDKARTSDLIGEHLGRAWSGK